MSVSDVAKEVGNLYRNLSASELNVSQLYHHKYHAIVIQCIDNFQVYKNKAEDAKKNYLGQLEQLKSTPEGLAFLESQTLSKDQRIEKMLKKVKMQVSRAETALNMPPKGTIKPMNLFIQEQMKVVTGDKVTEKMKLISSKFKTLSESEKEALKVRTDQMNQKRKSEHDAWASKMASSEKFKTLEELRAKQENLQTKLKDLKEAPKKKAEKEAKKAEKSAKKAEKDSKKKSVKQ